LKTIRDLRWLLTAGSPSLALKAATLLYLHGMRISASIRLKVREVDFAPKPVQIMAGGLRPTYATDELSEVLRDLAAGKSGEDLLLGFQNVQEFHADFRRMVRASKLIRFDLSDIKELFKVAAGNNYAILKGYRLEEPRSPEEIRGVWLKVLPRLVVGV
jgi:hypothetical protein